MKNPEKAQRDFEKALADLKRSIEDRPDRRRKADHTLMGLFTLKLASLEDQVGGKGGLAAILWTEYIDSLFRSVGEILDGVILEVLRDNLLESVRRHGPKKALGMIERLIQAEAGRAAIAAGYELELTEEEEDFEESEEENE